MREDETEGTYQGIVVPESVLVKREQKNRYGSVEGLDDEELADPYELERQMYAEEWAPILAIPRPEQSGIRAAVDESGGLDWGAFGTVDFERYSGGFDKARYKAEREQEQLRDKLIMLAMLKERLPGKAKYLVLKYLRMGVIDVEHIVSEDMLALAKLSRDVERKKAEIGRLYEVSARRRERQGERLLVRLA